ncbi:restriction endonuclease, SacI family [Micromonospora harpali]|uniref:Restriction endonuclease, SacI family n=1 Tax=Micromonospora harpali TaxID=1490225 RepID=A0ABW1HKP4_9ACTN
MAVGIHIDYLKAQAVLERAVAVAESRVDLPRRWVRHVKEVGESPRITDAALLGCSLLAKACDGRVNPLVVRLDVDDRGYHARGLADNVLAPARRRYKLDLGSKSAKNPLNSSSWLRFPRLEQLKPRHTESYERLLSVLRELDGLSEEDALLALAAWVRSRMAVAAANRPVIIRKSSADLAAVVSAAGIFVREKPEGGARGQALVAAAFRLLWSDVRTGKINDPSRDWPGDVHVFRKGLEAPVVAAEVKQARVRDDEIRSFADSCFELGIRTVFYATLHPRQPDLEDIGLTVAANHGATFTRLTSAENVVLSALAWIGHDLEYSVPQFIQEMLAALRQVELSAETQKRWAVLTASDFEQIEEADEIL